MRAGFVVATAGHVDHGKSALVRRLTGIEPDRWEEERRRGLTIDLGYAWTTLPGGRETGFVDVPGHERFVKNMLAGVGPVRQVLFVVGADEGWKPQSEEHLQIVDVLGAHGAVVALTKADLATPELLEERQAEIGAHLAGTALEGAAIVACSALTGEGMDELVAEIDSMLGDAPEPPSDGRPRLFVDRAFTIRGSGTVVTGTLTGGRIEPEAAVELLPSGARGRVRGLQRHGVAVRVAEPVSRIAVNLAGVGTRDAERGDALVRPGEWRPATVFEGTLRTVRGLGNELTGRGAFKIHAGAAERDARIRLLGADRLGPSEEAYVRVTLSSPLVLDHGEPFVLREAGRRETVGGGRVLDTDPPRRPGRDAAVRLERRRIAAPVLPAVVVAERGAITSEELLTLTGVPAPAIPGAVRLGAWWLSDEELERRTGAITAALEAHHAARPLSPGLDLDAVRGALERAAASLADAVLDHLESTGTIERSATTVRLRGHRLDLGPREDDARRIEAALETGWPLPPTTAELGADPELVAALAEAGRTVAVSRDLSLLPAQAAAAEAVAIELAGRPEGMTASAFRERLGTSRKYAIPILEWLDGRGVTRRDGDLRRLRAPRAPSSPPPPGPSDG